MCASWENEKDIEIPIKKLNSIRLSKDEEAKSFFKFTNEKYPEIVFDGIPFDEYFLIILSSISFNPQISDSKQSSLLREAIFKISQEKKVTKRNLIQSLTELENDFLSKPISKFKFITGISLEYIEEITRRKINDVTFTFSGKTDEILSTEIGTNIDFYIDQEYPEDYTTVNLFVKAKSIYEAHEKASYSLNILRGIWNFMVNRTKWPLLPETKNKPINSFKKAPITVGKELNNDSYDHWWYEESYPGNFKPAKINKSISKFIDVERDIRDKINKSNFHDDLQNFFVRYATSLDEKVPKKSLIKLWSLLEALTHTTQNSYSNTIRRAAFVFENYKYHELILDQLRLFRNGVVHEDINSEYAKYHVYQLKRHVEKLLLFLLNKGQEFQNMNEVAQFLNLPRNSKDLKHQIKLRELAIELRG